MLFTKPKDEIIFEDVETFCREFPEGVRVEYKQEVVSIPKIVSSFANTHGGVFVIGAETDEQNKVKFPIQGISQRPGIEEQIQQSALTGIYPGVIPEIILVDVPNSSNLVVIVRVDESIHAPHAIQNSTRAYIRTGSITQPYELAEMDRLVSMFKRSEDSQAITHQILDRIEKRVETFSNMSASNIALNVPNITVIAKPVFPYRPVISKEDIFQLGQSRRRVSGGAYILPKYEYNDYRELNEYGIVYQRTKLEHEVNDSEQYLNFGVFLYRICDCMSLAKSFYDKCAYTGNLEFTVQLREIFGKKLVHSNELDWQREPFECSDSDISASIQCLPRDLANSDRLIEMLEELTSEILWAFNTGKPKKIRELIKEVLRYNNLLSN